VYNLCAESLPEPPRWEMSRALSDHLIILTGEHARARARVPINHHTIRSGKPPRRGFFLIIPRTEPRALRGRSRAACTTALQ